MNSLKFFAVICGLGATAAAAAPRLQLQPVELLGYVGNDLQVRVELPCGARYFGLVLQTVKATSTLRVAAAVMQESIVCASMPTSTDISVDFLAVTNFKTITPMDVPENGRLVVAKISDLQVGSNARTTAVYEPKCGRDSGLLVHRAGPSRLELAFVERHDPGMRTEDCAKMARVRRITALAAKKSRLAALEDPVKSLSRAYSLSIRPASAASLAAGSTSVTVRHACNEAPIGLVLGRAEQRPDGVLHVPVGVLVAHYYNRLCQNKTEPPTTFAVTGITLPQGAHTEPLRARDQALRLQLPTRLGRDPDQELWRVKYWQRCSEPYTVYARDHHGALAVGLLTPVTSSCKTPTGEVSLDQPFVASSVPALYPLRLKGSPAH